LASNAISAATKEVNGTDQALHIADIDCCSSSGAAPPAARDAQHDKESADQSKNPTKSPQLTGPTSHTRIIDFRTFRACNFRCVNVFELFL
jgi:hypothetical protein